jgi:small subunit ribosomal protein S16
MSVRIRLQRHGRKQTPVYHIVIADARAPRDGSFIERIGTYNPMTKPASIEVDRMKAYEWITKGAQPTDTVRAILRFKGVMYYKHLQRGVSKGAMTPEDAELKFRAWVDEKEAKIQARANASKEERKSRAEAISGKAKPAQQKKEETPVDDELVNVNLAEQAAAETADDAEATEEVAEAPAAVVAEEPKEEENKEEATPEG